MGLFRSKKPKPISAFLPWDAMVARGNRWTVPVEAGAIAAARRGDWSIVLTPEKPVPRAWFPPLAGEKTVMTGIPGTPPDLRNLPSGCTFHPRCPVAAASCAVDVPILRAIEPGREAACHLVGGSS